jgi:hypothetical protein
MVNNGNNIIQMETARLTECSKLKGSEVTNVPFSHSSHAVPPQERLSLKKIEDALYE